MGISMKVGKQVPAQVPSFKRALRMQLEGNNGRPWTATEEEVEHLFYLYRLGALPQQLKA